MITSCRLLFIDLKKTTFFRFLGPDPCRPLDVSQTLLRTLWHFSSSCFYCQIKFINGLVILFWVRMYNHTNCFKHRFNHLELVLWNMSQFEPKIKAVLGSFYDSLREFFKKNVSSSNDVFNQWRKWFSLKALHCFWIRSILLSLLSHRSAVSYRKLVDSYIMILN